MASLEHVHKYVKANKKLWKCNDPYCTHTMQFDLVKGKITRCDCGETFILDREAMRRKHPKCINCSNTMKAKQHRNVKDVIGSIFGLDT